MMMMMMLGNCLFAGLFSLKKKIDDAVLRAERFGPSALELEQSKCIQQEEMIQDNNPWNDLAASSQIFLNLAATAKLVDALKDLKYKVCMSSLFW